MKTDTQSQEFKDFCKKLEDLGFTVGHSENYIELKLNEFSTCIWFFNPALPQLDHDITKYSTANILAEFCRCVYLKGITDGKFELRAKIGAI